jgi:hypothetical protein
MRWETSRPECQTYRPRGELILGWTPALAIAILLVNDHVLKHAVPGFVTGKISDMAGMFAFPLIAVSILDVIAPPKLRPVRIGPVLVVLLTVCVFATTKVTSIGGDVYGSLLGQLRGLGGFFSDHRVNVVRDPTDLIAVPFAFGAWFYAHRHLGNETTVKTSTRSHSLEI